MFMERLRNHGFWLLDKLRGGNLKKHYDDVKLILESETSHKNEEKYLNNILRHATKTSEYYKRFIDYQSINDFPIIDKKILRENQEKIKSDKYFSEPVHRMSTSGSTGVPFTIEQDLNKRKRVLSEIIYFGRLCGYNLGDRNTYLRSWTEDTKKSKLNLFKQNMVMIDVSKLDIKNLENIRQDLLKEKKLKCILGYANVLDILSKYMLKKGDCPEDFNVNIVISSSEVLNEVTRMNLTKLFGCNVISRYANQENGLLAQEPIDKNYFMLNNASYYFEFLKIDSDDWVKSGEIGRIVITDLFNYATPMIRYDTGDLAKVKMMNNKYIIEDIEGRQRDFIYNTKKELISPSAISTILSNVQEIKQYQFIQEDFDKYILKVIGIDINEEKIITRFKEILGNNSNINFVYVENIEPLSSGKFANVVNAISR